MHLVVIAFILVEDEPNPNAPRGNHTIALINTTEEYDNLVEALDDITTEINNLKSLTVNNVLYDLEFYFAADMKFEAICIGIESASSTYSCIWCKCPAMERHNITKTWSATNIIHSWCISTYFMNNVLLSVHLVWLCTYSKLCTV